ncbi:MAG: ABC transporter ATP-binding protein [Anaerolineae bacterium]|nr:ABC transporter ATP-binding protein [Anaerolineae bacterium]
MNTHATAISTENLHFSYNGPQQPVLRGLSLDIPAGSLTAILGPNGSGKTTLLRVLLGFLRPSAGTVRVAGRPLGDYTRREMGRLMALVPQSEPIPFNFSALEYVLLGRTPYLGALESPGPADRQVALEALRAMGAEALRERAVAALSGGEQQLVILARAMAQQPQVLLMDEPMAHLDLGNQGRIVSIMRQMAAAGVTVVFTTHDPNAAAAVASYVVMMRRGEVLTAAPTARAMTAANLSETYGVAVEVLHAGERSLICLREEA